MAYSLKEKSLEPDDVKKLLHFKELEHDEFQYIDMEVGMKKVKDILLGGTMFPQKYEKRSSWT